VKAYSLCRQRSRASASLITPEEFSGLDNDARILPVRQEQLKERLGDRFRELDVPQLAAGRRCCLSTQRWMIMKWNSIKPNAQKRIRAWQA